MRMKAANTAESATIRLGRQSVVSCSDSSRLPKESPADSWADPGPSETGGSLRKGSGDRGYQKKAESGSTHRFADEVG